MDLRRAASAEGEGEGEGEGESILVIDSDSHTLLSDFLLWLQDREPRS